MPCCRNTRPVASLPVVDPNLVSTPTARRKRSTSEGPVWPMQPTSTLRPARRPGARWCPWGIGTTSAWRAVMIRRFRAGPRFPVGSSRTQWNTRSPTRRREAERRGGGDHLPRHRRRTRQPEVERLPDRHRPRPRRQNRRPLVLIGESADVVREAPDQTPRYRSARNSVPLYWLPRPRMKRPIRPASSNWPLSTTATAKAC